MRTFIYGAWFLIPAFFFLLALWSKLESVGNKQKKENVSDLIKQGFFVTACAVVAIIVDKFFLQKIVDFISPDWIPLGFYQAILLPVIFVIVGKIVGRSKEIRITKAPHPSQRKRKR